MSNNVTFEVFSQDIEDSLEIIYYSNTVPFNLKKYENGNLVFDGEVTLVEIDRGRTDIPASDYDDIEEAFYEYIDNHNENLASHSRDIKFEITDIDARFACTYKEYLDGKLIKEGKGWAKDIENRIEREAWDDAVIKFRKENGIETSTDKMKKGVDEVNEAVDKLDTQFTGEIDLTPPLIETAIPTLGTNPCEFVENITRAVKTAISRINGLPNPTEIANYYVKIGKENLSEATNILSNAQKSTTQLAYEPVTQSYEGAYDYFRELDAEREEYLKTHSDEFYTFEVVDYEPPVLSQMMEFNGGSISGGNREEVIRSLGFTGSDTKEYCSSLMKSVKVDTLSGQKWVTVHKALAEEVQSIFRDIYNIGFNVYKLGSYNYRTINNPNYPNSTKLSMHSFGCAIDINYDVNPFSKTQKRPFEHAPWYWNNTTYNPNTCIWTNDHPVVKIFHNYEWGWGGRYGDFMHFSKANGG